MAQKKYLLIHMGGTIGMRKTPNGLAPPDDETEYKNAITPMIDSFKRMNPECDYDFVCLSTVDSNNINAEALEELAAYIRSQEDLYDGFLITHGTDTVASTAAALNMMFYDDISPALSTPIVMTAAQKIIHDTPTDAGMNFLHSLFALYALSDEKYYPIIAFVFRDNIINGAHIIKVSESRFNAFDAVSEEGILGHTAINGKYKLKWMNLPENIALTPEERKMRLIRMHGQPLSNGRLLISPLDKDDVPTDGYIHITNVGTLGSPKSYMLQGHDPLCLGILFTLSGIGNTGSKNYASITQLVQNYNLPIYGALVIPGGHTDMQEYAAGSYAFDAGIVSGYDVSYALAEVKLFWGIANNKFDNARPLLRQMAFPYDLSGIVKLRTDPGKIPDVYSEDAKNDKASFKNRVRETQSKTEAYRLFKGRNFRALSVPDSQKAHAAKFLPKADLSMILDHHKGIDFAELVGWTPFKASNQDEQDQDDIKYRRSA